MKSMINKAVALLVLLAFGIQAVAGCQNGACKVKVRFQPNSVVRVQPKAKVAKRKAVAPKAKAKVKVAPKKQAPKAPAVKTPAAVAPVKQAGKMAFVKSTFYRTSNAVKNTASSVAKSAKNNAKKLVAGAAVLGGGAAFAIKNERANKAVRSFLASVKENAAYYARGAQWYANIAADKVFNVAKNIGYTRAGLGFAAIAAAVGAYKMYQAKPVKKVVVKK